MEPQGKETDSSRTWLQKMKSNLYGLQMPRRFIMSSRRGRYIFTDNKHPARGIFSFFLGVLSVGTLVAAVLVTYYGGGVSDGRSATASLFAALFALIGLIVGLIARGEKDIYMLFPNLGIATSVLALLLVACLLYLGFR